LELQPEPLIEPHRVDPPSADDDPGETRAAL
jgi:hypothetical protein